MLDTFTSTTFAGRIGEVFRIHGAGAAPIETRLTEVTERDRPAGASADAALRRTPFSLLFRGPAQPVLPQRIYRVEHDDIGAFELFLVPIGPDAEGMRYEAVFS